MNPLLSAFKEGFVDFGHNTSALVNTALLSVVYFVGVGATSLAARASGKRFLKTELSERQSTYWETLDLGKKKLEDYYRQF